MGAESKLSAEAAARFVLGLSQGCSKEEVKRAFKRLALVFHPDKNKGQNEEEATRRFQAIATAKDLLLKTSGVTGVKDMGSNGSRTRPTPGATPKKPVYVATWMCGACQMRHLGSSPGSARTSEMACARVSSSTLCFCGHRFGAHELVEGGTVKFRCRHAGCACGNFSYVPPGALCTCGHGPQSHDAKPFHSCQVSGCLCQTFHHAGVCSCRHSWACHRTEIQKGASPYTGNPSTTKSPNGHTKTTFCPWRRPCNPEFSESDDGETKEAKASMPSTGSSRPPATPQRAASPQMPAAAPPAASAVPRGRVSAPSTPTGRRSSSFSTVGGDRFCMPTSSTSTASTASRFQSQPPIHGDGGGAASRDPRLDVRGKPIGRSPSGTSTGAATTDSQPRSATPRQSFATAAPKTEAASSESKKTRVRPSSAPPRREDSEAVPPVPPPVASRPPRPRPSSAGAKTSSRGATSAPTPTGKEAGEKASEKCPRWEDVNAEPDAEPDTEAESGSSHPREGLHQARIPRSAENPSPKRTWTVTGNPSGSASKVAAQAEAAAKAKAGARPWWLRLSRSKGMEDTHGEAFASTASAETVDEDIGHERMPTTPAPADRQRSQRSSAPSAVRFLKRPPRQSSTPPESPWTPPASAAPAAPEPVAAAPVPRRPPVPRAPRPKSAPPKRSVSFEVSPPDVVPRSEDNRDTKVAKDSSHSAENLKEGSTQERPVPSWPWVSPRFFGADSDDEGGPSNAPAKNPSETLRRLMELQRTLPTPIL